MKKGFVILGLAFGLLVLCQQIVLAAVEFFPLEELRVGLKGIGKTVVRGTKIETFDVEIIDILPEGGFDGGPLILARFSGEAVEMSNGIAAGYSGSPVYIDGKLLGAVSTAVPFSDTHIGGITPITSMLSALPRSREMDYSGNTVVPEPKVHRRLRFFGSYSEAKAFNEAQLKKDDDPKELGAYALSAPILVRGVSPLGIKLLKEAFKDNPYLEVMVVGGGSLNKRGGLLYKSEQDSLLQPGDAIAVSLVKGDIELPVIGTLTYIDERGQMLAFGHPLLLSGDASYPIGKAYIAYTHKSIMRAFKDGFRLNTVGTITKDKLSAVGGLLGMESDVLPMKVVVNDVDVGKKREFNVQIVREPQMFDYLASFVVSEAFVRTTDMAQGGTIRLQFTINGVGLKEPIKRINYFYDAFSPVSFIWDEAIPLASLLTNNIYREVKITEFDIQIDFTRNRVNASIDDAKILTKEEEKREAEKQNAIQAQESEEEGEGSEAERSNEQDGVRQMGWALQAPPALPEESQTAASGATAYAPPTPPRTVYQGETLTIEVRLQPFRQKPVFKKVYVTIPEDFPTGPTNIYVHGGGSLISLFNEFGGRGRILFGTGTFVRVDSSIHDLDKIIEKALSTPLNNEVVITIPKPVAPPKPGSQGTEEDQEEEEEEFQVSVPTKWVIYNQKLIPITIQPKQKAKRAEKPPETSKQKQ